MGMIQAIILSIIQGVTEFIPVSSSGHLVLFQYFLGVDIAKDNIFFEILTHFGTSIAIFLVFYKDISEIFKGLFDRDRQLRLTAWHYAFCIIAGSIPVAFVGLFLYDHIVAYFAMPTLAALMLLITGAILYSSKFSLRGEAKITLYAAILIGLAQALAPMPGISRSGITIVAALMIGLSRSESGRFSFLLALPALMGATFLDLLKMRNLETLPLTAPIIIVSLVVSTVVGIISLKILLNFIDRGQLHYFSYYCLAAGLASLILINIG